MSRCPERLFVGKAAERTKIKAAENVTGLTVSLILTYINT